MKYPPQLSQFLRLVRRRPQPAARSPLLYSLNFIANESRSLDRPCIPDDASYVRPMSHISHSRVRYYKSECVEPLHRLPSVISAYKVK